MPNISIGKYDLIMTCETCPEQYDVVYAGKKIAYMRLRSGHFYASVGGNLGEIVYSTNTKGSGGFDEDERMDHLNKAVNKIIEYRVANFDK